MGNVRLSYSDSNGDGLVDVNEIIEESNYYLFGLKHKGYNNVVNGIPNKLLTFNGVELEESLGLYETFARGYDPTIGRFIQIDPLGELIQQIDKTSYNFAWNNPILFNDPDGLCPDCPDPATAKQGDTYTIANGSVYVFNNGEWERQTIEELDEVVVIGEKPEETEEKEILVANPSDAESFAPTLAATLLLAGEVSVEGAAVGGVTITGGATSAAIAGVGAPPILMLLYLSYTGGTAMPTAEELQADMFFPYATAGSAAVRKEQSQAVTGLPDFSTPPAYQPLTAEEQLTLSAYINQMAHKRKKQSTGKSGSNRHDRQYTHGGKKRPKNPNQRKGAERRRNVGRENN